MPKLVECVPNFSEGRERRVIDAIADAITRVPRVKLLDVDPGADTNRTVYTFVGPPDAVADAALAAARAAAHLIDMSRHTGAHPRIGALDVCPFVPVSDTTMEECVAIARAVGERIADELQLPVYFYEYAATRDERRSLSAIRAGEYEGLPAKLRDPAWRPDRGPATFNARLGATIVGAREFLIAYNVNLNTRDRRLAQDIALTIRENGRVKRDRDGAPVLDARGEQERVPGRLRAVRAIGWYIPEYRQAQVSINLLDFRITPLHVIFDVVCEEASRRGLRVTGSELVGLIPRAPLVDAGRHYLRLQGKSTGVPERELVDMAVRTLGLDQLGPFDPTTKVIEYHFRRETPIASTALAAFADEVSSESPAPGGGSVAALAGALAAALVAMVGNLTVGKRGYEGAWEPLARTAERAQALKEMLIAAVDADADAFNAVVAAMRLPAATAEQQATRAAAMEEASRAAARVPQQVARAALDALALAEEVASSGYAQSISDAGVAAVMARAAVEGAVLNVLANLANVTDEPFRDACRADAATRLASATTAAERVAAIVRARLERPS